MDDGRQVLLARIERERLAFSGQFAFAAKNLGSGEEVGHDPERVMPTASTIKLCVLAELYRAIEAGDLAEETRVELLPEDRRGGSGILKDLDFGLRPTLHDLATLMVALSDNVATAALVRLLGREQILATVHSWGLNSTTAGFTVPDGGSALDYGASTPCDLNRLLELIATDAIISPAACEVMRRILQTQQYTDQISRYLPFERYARDDNREQPVRVGSKSGFMAGIRVDAGIVWLPNTTYVITLMTAESRDRSFAPEQESMRFNGRISRLVFDYWAPEELREREPVPDADA